LQNSESLSPVATPYNSTTYTLNVTGINGCETSGTQSVMVSTDNLKVSAGADVSVCQGSSVILQATGGSIFNWSPGISLNDSSLQEVMASPLETTTYVVSGSTQYCSGTDSITVFVLDELELDYPESYSICAGDSVRLSPTTIADESYTYVWSPETTIDNLYESDPLVYPIENQNYTLVASNNAGCSDTAFIAVNILEEAMLETSVDTTICVGDTIQLFANGVGLR